jgi:hypothetical protein
MIGMDPLLAQAAPPAGGAPLEDVVPATIVAAVAVLALAALTIRYGRGGASGFRQLVRFASKVSGLPPWAALPAAILSVSLLGAVFGFYWDVSTHIDNGRDPGPFANPSHYFILFGLAGIALAGYVSVVVGSPRPTATSVRLGRRNLPLGGLIILICGSIALLGFPLDDVWHRLFGQDVTLWGPTHVQMIGGAALSTLGLWLLLREAEPEAKPAPWLARGTHRALVAGAVLMGMSALQAEFDFAVPQFQLVFHPILIALAAGIALPAARIVLGPGGAIKAAIVFLALRGALTLLVSVALGRTMLHFPLYLAEALLVELVALRIPRERQISLGAWSGVAIGTVGVAAEWGWSHVWMTAPWPASLLPEGLVLGLVAGVAGGLIGAMIGRALAPPDLQRQRVSPWIGAAAGLAAVAVIALPLRQGHTPPISARVTLAGAPIEDGRWVHATVRMDPADAPNEAKWFHVLAWQGLEWRRGTAVVSELEPRGPGVFRTTEPVPVHGSWKTLVRLHRDDWIVALPIYMPRDPAIPAPEIPASASFDREFVRDTELLQREAVGGTPALWTAASIMLLGIAALWIGVLTWAFIRFDRAEATGRTSRDRAGALNGRPKEPEEAHRR